MANILQSEVLTDFVYPFLLIFFIVFAILEKTELFGKDKKQLNAFSAAVIGMIFVAAVTPRMIVENLILFLSVAIVIVFVVLILWSFITGESGSFASGGKAVKIIAAIVVILAVIIAMFLITGIWDEVIDTLFRQSWSEDVWVNIIFIVIVAAAIAAVIVGGKKAKD